MKRFLTAFVLALGLVQVSQAANDWQTQTFFNNTGGLVDRISPLLVPPENATAISNVSFTTRGQLDKRNGYTALNTGGALGDATNGAYVTGGTYHDSVTGTDFFAVVAGTNVYRTANTFGATYVTVTGSVTITASATNLAQAAHLNDFAIFCNESDAPFYLGASGNALAITTSTVQAAKTCTTMGSYLILGNTTESSGTGYPNRVHWSDIQNQNSYPANNYIDIEPNDGDRIIALVSFEDKVYVFKKRSIYQLFITGDSGANAFIYRPIARGIGAWAKMSVQVIPNVGVAFLSQNTIYTLSDSGLTPIGDSIQTTLNDVSRSQWANSVGVVYPKRYQYQLTVSADGTTPAKTLVYDYLLKAWTTYNYSTSVTMAATAESSGGDNLLLTGDATGYVYKQDTGSSDYPLNVKTVIASSYTTANLTFNSPNIRKTFKYLYLYTNVVSTATLTIETADDFSTSFENTYTTNLGQVGATYDTAVYDADPYAFSTSSIIRIELNETGRAIRFRFSNSTADAELGIVGFAVVYRLEDYSD